MLLTGCQNIVYKAEQTRVLMGTTVKITVIHKDGKVAVSAIQDAFTAMQNVEKLMSIYDNNTELSTLNKNKILRNPSQELLYVLNRSLFYSNISNGAFDVTVQPTLDLFTNTFNVLKRSPTEQEILAAQKKIDYKKIIFKNNSIVIGPNTTITLGAIAKGYAVDKAIEVLQSEEIDRALVIAGGDLRAIGTAAMKQPWIVSLQNPRNSTEYITLIEVHDQSVATSGDYERYFDENKTFHHIINPKTGMSATELISVTIIAPKAMDADALGTTVFVLGPVEGMKLIESTENTEALIITRDRQIIRSSGFKY